MRRTVAAQGMMGRQMAQGMMGRQIMLHRGRGRWRGFLCDNVIGKAHSKRDRDDKGLDHGDDLSKKWVLSSEIDCDTPPELPMNASPRAASR